MHVSLFLLLLTVSLRGAAQTDVDSTDIILNRLADGRRLTCDKSEAEDVRRHILQEFSLRPPAAGQYALDLRSDSSSSILIQEGGKWCLLDTLGRQALYAALCPGRS